jgi:hypothetical protein
MKNVYLPLLVLVFCFNSNTKAINGFNSSDNTPTAKAEILKEKLNKGEFSISSFAFTENKGQVFGYDGLAHPEVKFVFQQGGTQIFLLEKGIAYQFTKVHYPEGYQELMRGKFVAKNKELLEEMRKQIRTETFRMDMTLLGANKNAEIIREGISADFSNFYNHEVLDVHTFNKITYHEIYPGIDWVIYTKENELKYDFIVRPGADASLIKMQFDHQENITLNNDGSFTLRNSLGNITEKTPISFQGEKSIGTKFVLNRNIITFDLADYNKTSNLIIDPNLLWATYYGGTGDEYGNSCSTDPAGNVYFAGITDSPLNIASFGHQNTYGGSFGDAFLVKFSSSGIRQWATYYGGSSYDYANSCSVDVTGNIYLCGGTSSSSGISYFGHQNTYAGNGNSDAFLAKFSNGGILLWATYYGGTGLDEGLQCVTDASANVYLAGNTRSSSNIASGGHLNSLSGSQDAFLVKFNSSGVRLWATYYGATFSDADGNSCAVDNTGNVYLAGTTAGGIGIASGGHQNTFGGGNDDAFLVKFNSSGVRQWGTYYGGSGITDAGYSCATDVSGNVYLAGETDANNAISSGGHQNSNGGSTDAFLVKFNGNGIRQWGTYYGGSAVDRSYVCFVDPSGNIYLGGITTSIFGIAFGGYQNSLNGGADAFLAKFNTNGARQWGTYFGGPNDDYGVYTAIDISNNVFIAGRTDSYTGIASGGHQLINAGGFYDGFLAKFCNGPEKPTSISGNLNFCAGTSQVYSVTNDVNVIKYIWTLPVGWSGSSITNSISGTPGSSGLISVTASNVCSASAPSTVFVTVNPLPTITISSINTLVCVGDGVTLNAGGANSYSWTGGVLNNIEFIISQNSTYTVVGTTSSGCSNTATINIEVDACTGIDKLNSLATNFLIFPNPNNGEFVIKTSQEINISVINSLGQIIHQQHLVVGKNLVDLNNQANGIYFLELKQETKSMRVKIIKQ